MRKLVAVLVVLAAVVAVPAVVAWLLVRLEQPQPAEELLAADATIDLSAYEGSEPPDAGTPSVLILGTVHLVQDEHGYTQEEFDRVTDALAAYDADLVAVEYLPPQWPQGRGRDYRPGFDVAAYADEWGLPIAQAEALVEEARDPSHVIEDHCELGRAYFLTRDLVNAHYVWDTHGCTEARGDERIQDWWETLAAHEIGRIAQPVARANELEELVSFDYQGEDAAWILDQEAFTLDALLAPGDLWQMLPTVSPTARQGDAHITAHDERLVDLLDHLNSPDWIGVQYWVYEQQFPQIEVRDAGRRQRDNYWLRNQRMFELLDEAVRQHDAERVLVVVGVGHKYFLDELAREHGYRWVDPREYLPSRG